MVTEVVHFGAAYFAIVAEGRAGRARAEQGNTQPELEGSAKLVGLQCETKTWNRGCKQPVAGVGHRAGKHQVVAAGTGPCHQLLENGLVPLRGELLLHALLSLQIDKVVWDARSGFVFGQKLSHARGIVMLPFQQSSH
jgi:hypothetical protein